MNYAILMCRPVIGRLPFPGAVRAQCVNCDCPVWESPDMQRVRQRLTASGTHWRRLCNGCAAGETARLESRGDIQINAIFLGAP